MICRKLRRSSGTGSSSDQPSSDESKTTIAESRLSGATFDMSPCYTSFVANGVFAFFTPFASAERRVHRKQARHPVRPVAERLVHGAAVQPSNLVHKSLFLECFASRQNAADWVDERAHSAIGRAHEETPVLDGSKLGER